MWGFHLFSGRGKKHALKVSEEGTIGVVVHPHPPLSEGVVVTPYRADFTNSAGLTQMGTAIGSLTAPIDFSISASDKFDTYVKTISVEITDRSPQARLFGALPRLPNGVQFLWQSQEAGTLGLAQFHSNFEFLRVAPPRWGDGTTVGLISNAVAINDDTYLIDIDTSQRLGPPWGLILRKGTTDKIIFRIRDDLTGLVSFTAIAGGIQQLPED